MSNFEQICLSETPTVRSGDGSLQVGTQKLRVLLIDDEHTVADTLALILKMNGFQATTSYSGEHGLELARRQQFDFLISDVVMPGMNGIQAAIGIRELQPNCRILLVSGHAETAEMLKSANAKGHAFEILAKPFHPLFLIETLRKPLSPTSPPSPSSPTIRKK